MLQLDRLTCGYGPFRAVTDLSLEVPDGSGAGPDRRQRRGQVLDPDGGRRPCRRDGRPDNVRWRGHHRRAGARPVGRGIALAPEGRRLFPDLTVQENLTVGGYSRPRNAEARNIGRVMALFPRLEGRLKQLAGSMSGGEQQMLAIGRALMAEPKLLMIDEVSLGLMPTVIDVCYAALGRLRDDGLAILLVEQSTQRAFDIADTVCVLESGKAVWTGSAKAAREDPALVEAYLGLAG